ncbi:YfbM family protein [Luteipulveratus flavus]|uniref:YfbM family protein n=1 Tax=Luteipulveratus flavus TaxID=3031728 RepID=A0ABT6C2V3_9MICO|nr:YfbM family protein [Luteipulveratus sp. YIM 133296]MDF8263283.1 YfbM family protein [Luteipulveratus sp. YIM 133296]
MGMIWEGRAVSAAELARLRTSPEYLWQLRESGGEPPAVVDLDKAWHALHWLLAGDDAPTDDVLADAIMGGVGVGEDTGYGPARVLEADRVAEVAAALAPIDVPWLRARYDPQRLSEAEIYPDIWDEDDVFEEYLAFHFTLLKALYAHAAERRCAVVQAIT